MNLQDKTNEELDRMVAEAQGWKKSCCKIGILQEVVDSWFHNGADIPQEIYHPTTNDAQAIGLLKKYKIALGPTYDEKWSASTTKGFDSFRKPNTTRWVIADVPNRAIVIAVVAALTEVK